MKLCVCFGIVRRRENWKGVGLSVGELVIMVLLRETTVKVGLVGMEIK